MFDIAATLDRARLAQGLRSDYKLALVMGVSHTAMNGYRKGKTLPDVRTIRKITDLTGDDPALMTAEIEYARAKDDETRSIWSDIAQRLKLTTKTAQAGFSRLGMMACVFSLALLAGASQLAYAASHIDRGFQSTSNLLAETDTFEPSKTLIIIHRWISRAHRWFSRFA